MRELRNTSAANAHPTALRQAKQRGSGKKPRLAKKVTAPRKQQKVVSRQPKAAPKAKPQSSAKRVPKQPRSTAGAELYARKQARWYHRAKEGAAAPPPSRQKQNGVRRVGLGVPDPDPEFKAPTTLLRGSGRFHVAVTTYNRPEMLRRLLRQLQVESGRHEVAVHVYDDGGSKRLREDDPVLKGVRVHRYAENNGKAGYWRVVSQALADAAQGSGEYFLLLQDDVELVPGFFDEVRRQWEMNPDRSKAALFMLRDRQRDGKACWTNFKPRVRRYGGLRVTQTQWTDCMFFTDRRFFGVIPAINPVVPAPTRGQSSGVGRQISLRLHRGGYTIYQVSKSLVLHGDHESVMHPRIRRLQPLTT